MINLAINLNCTVTVIIHLILIACETAFITWPHHVLMIILSFIQENQNQD